MGNPRDLWGIVSNFALNSVISRGVQKPNLVYPQRAMVQYLLIQYYGDFIEHNYYK